MADTDWPALLREDIAALSLRIEMLTREVREAIVQAHAPGSCLPIAELMKEAKNSSAFREQVKGAWKGIALLGGLIGATLGIFVEWLLRR